MKNILVLLVIVLAWSCADEPKDANTSAEMEELQKSAEERFPPLTIIKEVYQAIANYLQLPAGSGEGTYFDFDWPLFINRFKFSAPAVMQCLKMLIS